MRVTFVGDVSDSFDSNLLDAGVLVFTREQVPVADGDACMGDSDLSRDARCDLERSEGWIGDMSKLGRVSVFSSATFFRAEKLNIRHVHGSDKFFT